MLIKDHLMKLPMWWQRAQKLRNDRPGGAAAPLPPRQFRHWLQMLMRADVLSWIKPGEKFHSSLGSVVTNGSKNHLLQKVILRYGERSLFWSLIIFGYLSFTTVRGRKIGFNSCEFMKFLNIANVHALDVWVMRILICNNKVFSFPFFCLFLLQCNFFPLRCQEKFLTSAKFLTCCCFSVILLLRIKK